MRKNSKKSILTSERSSLNKENLHPLQAHYQQYLQQQQQNLKFTGSYSTSNMSNNQFHSSADLSLSQSVTSDANQTFKMIDSQRSSRLQMSKKSLPQNYNNLCTQKYDNNINQNSNIISNSGSSKGTPSFQHGQRTRKGGQNNQMQNVVNSANSNQTRNSHKHLQNIHAGGSSQAKQSTLRKPQNTPMVVDYQQYNGKTQHINFYQKNDYSNDESHQQQQFKRSDNLLPTSMRAQHKKNQPSMSSNNSSAQQNSQFYNVNKHLRFDSIQDSSSATNHQLLSITSQHYQNLISGSSEDEEDHEENRLRLGQNGKNLIREYETEKIQSLREMMEDSPKQLSTKKNQITLNNSLLECVDQYGNNIDDQYSILMESDHEDNDEEEELGQTSSKKQLISELNNPNSYLNTVTKDMRAYGSIHQDECASSNMYNVQLANIVSNPNFVVCSPSANTDDDCQYTNSSALRSIATSNSALKQQFSYGNQRSAQLIYTDERKEEDLDSQAIDENRSQMSAQNILSPNDQRQECQFSSDGKDQFTGDNGDDDEEIESKLNIITGSSQIYRTKDFQDKGSSSYVNDSILQQQTTQQDAKSNNKFEIINQTPGYQNQFVMQVLDSDSRKRIINDTPQVMEMIDQSNANSNTRRKPNQDGSDNKQNEFQQLSPEVLGSRENRRRAQKKANNDKGKQDQTRNSSRYLNFKDISPLVKSCNTFAFENTLPNQSTLEAGIMGKISPPFLQNHCPSVLQQDTNFRLNQTQQSQQFSLQNNIGGFFQQTQNGYYNQQRPTHHQHYQTTTLNSLVNINKDDICSPNQKEEMSMTNKLSSVIESPPPLTDMTPEKGVKDFSRQYLGQGMWPSKGGHFAINGETMNSRIHDASLISSKVNNSMKIGEQIKRLENQMSSVSKKIQLEKQHKHKQSQIYSSVDVMNQPKSFQILQNSSNKQEQMSQIQEKLSNIYPNIDASIVQKINTTLDNMNNQFYFKRPSDHIGIGSSSITQLRTSRDNSKNNISGLNLLSNFNHPNQIGTHQPNTMVNNTVFNQSSFDDMCNIHGGTADHPSNITNLQIANDLYYGHSVAQGSNMNQPYTSRSHNISHNQTNNNLNQSKLTNTGVNTSTISMLNQGNNNTLKNQTRNNYQSIDNNRLSNVSDKIVKQVTLNGFGLGTINQRMQGTTAGTTTDTFNNTYDNNYQMNNNMNRTLNQNTQQFNINGTTSTNHLGNHTHNNFNNEGMCCKECYFEKEKRQVTQKAFERALGISLFLMEEIDKINLKDNQPNYDVKGRPSNLTQSTNNQLQVSRQEILNLMNQTQFLKKNQISPTSDLLNGSTTHQNSHTRLTRSKSQSMMPLEFANLQRSLQIPRGGFANLVNGNILYNGAIFNNTSNLSYM